MSSLALGDVTASGAFRLELSSSPQQATLGGVTLPAGPFLRMSTTSVTITFGAGGPVLTGSASVTRTVNSLGQSRVVVAVANAGFSLDGTTSLLSGVTGLLVVTPAGVAATVSGTVDLSAILPASVTVSGTFSLAVNRSSARVTESVSLAGQSIALDLPAGPYVRVAAAGAVVTIAGQSLSGDAPFTRSGTTTSIRFDHVAISLGGGLVSASEGSGSFTLTGTGPTRAMFGALAVTLAVTVPGLTLGGTFSVQVNTSFRLGPDGRHDDHPGRQPACGRYRGHAEHRWAQQISGDFWFQQTTSNGVRVVSVSASNVLVFLGSGAGAPGSCPSSGAFGVCLSGSGSLRLTPTGIAASLSGTLTLASAVCRSASARSLSPSRSTRPVPPSPTPRWGWTFPPGRSLRFSLGTEALPVSVTLFDQTLTGVFSFERATTPDRTAYSAPPTTRASSSSGYPRGPLPRQPGCHHGRRHRRAGHRRERPAAAHPGWLRRDDLGHRDASPSAAPSGRSAPRCSV